MFDVALRYAVTIATASRPLVVMACAAGLLVPVLAGADSWYVNPQGGDAATISEAVQLAADGDTILIAPGTYNDAVYTTKGLHFWGDEGGEVVWDAEADNSALYIENASEVSVRGITFTGDDTDGCPGLVMDENAGIVEVHDCTFRDMNAGWSGGAAFLKNQQTDLRSCTFRNITTNGTSQYAGGAVYLCTTSPCSYVIDCTFENCSLPGMGGALDVLSADGVSPVHIESCSFVGCTAENGGALFAYAGPITVTGCLFENNEATLDGGALGHWIKSLEIQDCIFRNNRCGNQGGAIYTPSLEDEVLIHHNLFWDNHADDGGALYTVAVLASLDMNTFFRNSASTRGAAISANGTQTQITRCILTESDETEALYCGVEPTISCCDFWLNFAGHTSGCADPFATPSNAQSDPMICNWHTEEFGVASGSVCAAGNLPSGCTGQIGAYGVGCASTPVRSVSWGEMRSLFRPPAAEAMR